MAPRASTSHDTQRKSGATRRSVKEQIDARLLRERQHALRKAFQEKFRASFKVPPSGERAAEVRPKGWGHVSNSTFLGKGASHLYLKAYDKKGKATGEEWDATFQGSDDLRPREFRQAGGFLKRSWIDSDDEPAESAGEVDAAADTDAEVDEGPTTSSKGKGKAKAKAKASDDVEKPARRAPSTPRKPCRAPAAKRVRRTPVKKPSDTLDDDAAEKAATAEPALGRDDNREPTEPPIASTSGSSSHAANSSSSTAVASSAGTSSAAANAETGPQAGLGRGKRVTRGLYRRPPTRSFGPAFAAAPEGVIYTFAAPAFQTSPRKSPRSVGGESVLERLCSQVDDLDVKSSAASMSMDAGECGVSTFRSACSG